MIFNNLEKSYQDRERLGSAAEHAQSILPCRSCFYRAYVGNVHAIAHTFGGTQHPHGYANAIILPHVLRHYGKAVHKELSELADVAEISEEGDTEARKSGAFH